MSEIAIRSIQHYMYCPHRWGLIEIDKAWAENIFVTKACLMHKRVHDLDKHYFVKGKRVYTSVPIYNDKPEYNLYGVADCIELAVNNSSSNNYDITVVEYKPTMPKHFEYNEDDLMQVFAQKVCVDYIFKCDCNAIIYYADKKKRVHLPLHDNYDKYDSYLKSLLREMRQNLENGKIPPIKKGQRCSGCSMKDLCMPSIKKISSVQKLIADITKEHEQK